MVAVWLWWSTGCASLAGLEELPALPPDFPLTVDGEHGPITVPKGGRQVAVDVVFEEEADARVGWSRLRDEAVAGGFVQVEEGKAGKRDRVVFEGPRGRIELACCPQRADKAYLVFVSWWPPAGTP